MWCCITEGRSWFYGYEIVQLVLVFKIKFQLKPKLFNISLWHNGVQCLILWTQNTVQRKSNYKIHCNQTNYDDKYKIESYTVDGYCYK